MAFVQSAIPEEQQNQFGSGAPTTPNPLSLLPPQTGGAASGGGPTTPAASGVGSPTQFGTSASKLSDYLSANADQIQNQGNALAGQLTDQYGKTMGDVNSAVQGFGAQVQGGYTPANQATIDSFSANPTKFASDPGNVKNFQGLYGDTYSGPQNFETTPAYANVQNEVSKAVENAGQFNSPSGLSTYLTNTATGTYTPGMATLDSVLLAGNPNASAKVTAAAKPFAGLNDYLKGQTAQADTAVPAAQKAASDAQAATRAAYTGVADPFVQNLNTNYQGAIDQVKNYNSLTNDITGKVGAGDLASLAPQESSFMGLRSEIPGLLNDYSSIWGPQAQTVNVGNYYNPGAQYPTPTAGQVMTQDQLDMAKALQMLSGNPLSLPFDLPEKGADQPFNAAGLKPPSFDNTKLLQDLLSDTSTINSASPDQAYKANQLNKTISGLLNVNPTNNGPTTAPPAPGSSGDLGAGFHWDTTSGTWVPTIPLQQPGGTTGGSGFHAF